jgi:hypothetical protein
MVEHTGTNTAETYARFVARFQQSVVGIVGLEQPDGAMAAGQSTHGDGEPRLIAFADPEVASQIPGSQCNAGLPGQVLLDMAAADPESAGILVNCATQPISVIISRASALTLLGD